MHHDHGRAGTRSRRTFGSSAAGLVNIELELLAFGTFRTGIDPGLVGERSEIADGPAKYSRKDSETRSARAVRYACAVGSSDNATVADPNASATTAARCAPFRQRSAASTRPATA